MEDSKIIQLFWERDEAAVSAVSEKYGRYCAAVARNIIGNEQFAEECVNDTLMGLLRNIYNSEELSERKIFKKIYSS